MTGTVPPVAYGWRIVIADDSPDDRAELRRLLLQGSERRYDFIEVETAAQTLNTVLADQAGPPDCLILDYFLPDADGPSVLADLRSDDGVLVCPVIVITGREGGDLGSKALRAGAQDFIGKAWLSAPSLTRAIENTVTRWEMARELEATKARLRLLAQAVPHPVWMTDGVGSVLYVNELWTNYFGADNQPVQGQIGWLHLVHPSEAREALEHWSRAVTAGAAFELNCRLRRQDGEYRWHVVNAGPDSRVELGRHALVRRQHRRARAARAKRAASASVASSSDRALDLGQDHGCRDLDAGSLRDHGPGA